MNRIEQKARDLVASAYERTNAPTMAEIARTTPVEGWAPLSACVAALRAAPEFTTLRIPRSEKLDPITVYLDDRGDGRGRVTIAIACYGDAWTCSWGALGGPLLSFLANVDAEYLAGAMLELRRHTKHDRVYAVRIARVVVAAAQEANAAAAEEPDGLPADVESPARLPEASHA